MKVILIIFLSLVFISCANKSGNVTGNSSFKSDGELHFRVGSSVAMHSDDILLTGFIDGKYNVFQSYQNPESAEFIPFASTIKEPSLLLKAIKVVDPNTLVENLYDIAVISYPDTNEISFYVQDPVDPNVDPNKFLPLPIPIEHGSETTPGYLYGSSLALLQQETEIYLGVGSPKGIISLDDGKQVSSGFVSIYQLYNVDNIHKFKYLVDQQVDVSDFYNYSEKPEKFQDDMLFGKSLAVNDNCLVVGAPNFKKEGFPTNKSGRIFSLNATNQLTYTWALDQVEGDPQLGWSLALHNNWLIVGIPGFQVNGQTVGAVNVFNLSENCEFKLVQSILSPSLNHGDQFGYSVAISDTGLVIGAPGLDDRNSDDVLNSQDIGAVYYYSFDGVFWKLTQVPEISNMDYITYKGLF